MDGVATKGSEVLASAETSDGREFRPWNQDFRRTLMANPYMGLQIYTTINTRRVEDERGRKKRIKSQGTLEVRISHGGCILEERGRRGETPNPLRG